MDVVDLWLLSRKFSGDIFRPYLSTLLKIFSHRLISGVILDFVQATQIMNESPWKNALVSWEETVRTCIPFLLWSSPLRAVLMQRLSLRFFQSLFHLVDFLISQNSSLNTIL